MITEEVYERALRIMSVDENFSKSNAKALLNYMFGIFKLEKVPEIYFVCAIIYKGELKENIINMTYEEIYTWVYLFWKDV